MDRQQAMKLLKELAVNDLVEPTFVHICERAPDLYQIQIRTRYNRSQLDAFAKRNNLSIEEDREKRYLVIYKR